MTSNSSITIDSIPSGERTRPPAHPGAILRRMYMQPAGQGVSELAERLGVSRKTLSKLLNERGGLTVDMALRLSRVFRTTPQLWLNLQTNHDLFRAMSDPAADWKSVEALPALIDA